MSSRTYSGGRWAGRPAEREGRVVYVVGEEGGAAQLLDAARPGPRLLAEAAALMHALADRVEAIKRGLER